MSNLAATIDRLGELKAMMANLKIEEQALREVLVENGPGSYEGAMFRATVSASERATLDMAAVRAKLSRQFITANTIITEVTTVRLAARSNARIAA